MIHFPQDLYTDIRIETVARTLIEYENFRLKQKRAKTDRGALIRIFDGQRWYHSATTDLEHLQRAVDELAAMATRNLRIAEHRLVRQLEVNREVCLRYQQTDVAQVAMREKLDLLDSYVPLLRADAGLQVARLLYLDQRTLKHIFSSQGTDVRFDSQNVCVAARYVFAVDGTPCRGGEDVCAPTFADVEGRQAKIADGLRRDREYHQGAVPLQPGSYTCVLAPTVAGVFAHESFGHKSEADFMVGDEAMKRGWALGKRVASPGLSIIDSGQIAGSGYVPFDDEGTRAKETYLIRDGILSGRLHSSHTAADLGEQLTGNARAISFEHAPLVRMTTTYIGAGQQSREELFAGVENGLYIDGFNHGSGMTTFTIAPSRAYRIRHGQVAEPVKVAVISGNVMETLHQIDGLSDQVELHSFALGGCGKMEQHPLSVSFGGPYVRVNGLRAQ